jgi:hypothetical protein
MQVRENLTELLCGPLGGGMLGHVAVPNATRADFPRHDTGTAPEVTVIDTKKSQATIAFAWLRTNVAQH